MAPPTRLTEPERTSPTAKTTGQVRLQRSRFVAVGEAAGSPAGEHEAIGVQANAAADQPVCLGFGADEQKTLRIERCSATPARRSYQDTAERPATGSP